MREIKFRAWDTFNAVYYYSTNYPNLFKFFEVCQKCIDGGNILVFEQLTGLKDTNGKEIYEGDILLYTRQDWQANTGAKDKTLQNRIFIRWDAQRLEMRCDMYDNKRCFGSGPLNADSFMDYRAKRNFIQIIGNIHENPELLKS